MESEPVVIDDTVSDERSSDEMYRRWEDFRARVAERGLKYSSLLEGVERVYSTSEVARFFGKSYQWVYWGLTPNKKTGKQVFCDRDGNPISPEKVGPVGKRRFTLPIIREIALCCYRRGNLSEEELEAILAKVLLAEFGKNAFAE